MFVMTLYRCLFRNNQMHRTPIFSLFLRDGVFWFLAILPVVTTPDIIIMALAQEGNPALLELMMAPTVTIYSLVGSRVLLNIKTLLATNEVLDTTNSLALRTFGDHTTEFRAATRYSDCTIDLEIGESKLRFLAPLRLSDALSG
ncbi:hypothetical protein BD779DRAFT_1681303 [Infundibulicybe gibba]|nr:hypothetical protein BD779DRAFT_1681303 [Infundibulicybe gibba]